MFLILMTHSSNPDYNADCDCAVVKLTPELLEEIRARIALAHKARQKDANLSEIHFWGSSVDYFAYALIDTCQEAVTASTIGGDAGQAAQRWLADLENTGRAVLPEGVDLSKFDVQQTECDRMIVSVMAGDGSDAEISWEATAKHTDICITTWDVTLANMQDLIAGRPPL